MTPNKIMHIDIEVDNHPYYGAVASPRHPENYVVMSGVAIDKDPYDGDRVMQHYRSKEEAANWLHIPDDVWLLVAHNALFELDWMLVQQREEIEKFLKRGGRVFCTAYAHYLLSNQMDTYPSLDEIAPLYGGTHKVDGIKILWDQGYLTSQIDPELLGEYLIGDEGDIENTRKVFYGVASQLQARGMWNMALERMEGMMFCAYAMASGLYVDRDVAKVQMHDGNVRLEELRAEFRKHRDLPEDCEFKESSRFHMSAWVYGGPLKYKAKVPAIDADGNQRYVKGDFYYFGEHRISVEHVTSAAVSERFAELYGPIVVYKSGKNKGLPKVFREDTYEPLMKWGEKVHYCPGLVDLTKLPPTLVKEFMKDHTGKQTLADDSPVISTGADALEILAVRAEFGEESRSVVQGLLEFAKLDKDLGTYYLREELDDDGNVLKQSGMLQYLTDKSVVHHNLNVTATGTGRLSSNRPNAQNFPRGGTSTLKRLFTSRFGDDGYIMEADYSALEVVCLAAFSMDKNLIEALMQGTDMHCMRLAGQLGEPYEDVLEKCKNENHPEHERYDQMRTDVKPKAFAYQYGATAFGIAFATGCTVEEAQEFIDAERALFPEVEEWYEEEVFAKVESNTKRHKEQVGDFWRTYCTGTWQSTGGTTYEFRQFPKAVWENGRRSEVMAFKPTQMRNYPIQGESGFFVQGISGAVFRWLLSKNFFDGKVYIINQVHDAFYLDVHKDVLDEVAAGLKAIMESLPQFFNTRHGYNLTVPFPADVSFGPSMMQQVGWKPGVLQDEKAVASLDKYRAELKALKARAAELEAA